MSYTIDIKRIRNKYDINLNAIIDTTQYCIVYEGYKLNTVHQNLVIIHSIPLKNHIKPIKLNHPYAIEIIDIIYDNSNAYIIYPNYKYYNNIIINSQLEFNVFFNQFRDLIKYILENKLNIEPIRLSDIYMKDNIYVLVHAKQYMTSIQNIVYGSPVYSPPKLFLNHDIQMSEKLLWNFGIIMYEIIKMSNPYNNCRELKDIMNMNFEKIGNEPEDNFINMFLAENSIDRITLDDFFKINIEQYNFFDKKENNNENNNESKIIDDMFDIEL
jgi:hypothetical protein